MCPSVSDCFLLHLGGCCSRVNETSFVILQMYLYLSASSSMRQQSSDYIKGITENLQIT